MNTKNSSADARAPRSGRKRLLYASLGVLLLLVLLVALLPAALSTAAGRGLLLDAVNDRLRGAVTLEALSLSWFGGQQMRGVALLEPDGTPILTLKELSTELTLVQALLGKLVLGRTLVRGLALDLRVDPSGESNLTRALGPESDTGDDAPLVIPFTGNIDLADTRITVTAPDTEPVSFDDLTGTLRIDPTEYVLNIDLQGSSRQGDDTGAFAITGRVTGLIAADGALTPQTADGLLEAELKDLPMDGVDGLLGLGGLLRAAAGERANLNLRASGTATTQNLTVNVDAPLIQGDLAATIADGRLSLTQPSLVGLKITPALFALITRPPDGEAAMMLRETFPLNLKIEQLGLPVAGLHTGDVALRAAIEVPQTIKLSATGELGDVSVSKLNAGVQSERLGESLGVTLTAEVTTRGAPGEVKIEGTLRQLLDEAGMLQPDKLQADVDVDVRNLPTVLVDQLSGQNGRLVALLGAKMNLNAALKSSGPERIDGALSIDAGPLQARDVAVTLTDIIALTKPAEIRYRLTPESARYLLGPDAPALLQPTAVTLQIEALSIPRPRAGAPALDPANTRVGGVLTSEAMLLSGIPELGTLHISQGRVELSGETLAGIRLAGAIKINDPKAGMLAELDASPLEINMDAATGLQNDGRLQPIIAGLRFNSSGLNGDLKMRVAADFSQATLTEPASLQAVVRPGLLRRFGVTGADQTTLGKPARVGVALSRLALPLSGFTLAGVQTAGTLTIEELVMAGPQPVSGTGLRDIGASFDFDGAKDAVALGLTAQTQAPGTPQPGALKLEATLTRVVVDGALNPETPAVDAKFQVNALPVALVEALSGQTGLAAMFGGVMDVDGGITNSGDQSTNVVDIKARSQHLTADAGFQTGQDLVLNRPAKLSLTLTPEAYAVLTGAGATSGYRLAENATVEAVIEQLRWPMDTPADATRFNPSRAGVVAALSIPRLGLRDPADQKISLETLKINVQGGDLGKPVDFQVSGVMGGGGRLELSGRAAGLLAADGGFDAARAAVRMDGRLQALPVGFVDQMLEMDGLVAATFGDTADLSLTADLKGMTGPLDLVLKSANATANLSTRLAPDNLVLRQPLVAEARVTEAFGKLVLGKIHPIFETTQSGERPVRFEIPAEGVAVPIRDFDLTRVVIPRMTLDLGSLILKSGWLLKGTIGLAQKVGALKSSGRDQWTARFTPAVMQVRNGRVTYDRRLDLLLDERLHLATWGTADLAANRADLTLAFMPETLEKVFGLTVGPGDAFRLPLSGPLDAPSIDFGKAGLELGRLKAQQQLTRKNQLLGAVIGAAAQTASGGGPIPPASVDPLPWGPLPVPEGQTAAAPQGPSPEPQPAPRSAKEQAIEGLIDLLRKKSE